MEFNKNKEKMKKIANYHIESEPLGKGQFGEVHRCQAADNPAKHYAVKIVKKSSLTPRLFNNLKNEIDILSKIESPHVVRLVDIQRTENNFYLVMELCNAGDLEGLKEIRGGRFSELEARIILRQLVAGFKEIYKKQVMHRDLKLANILVNLPDLPYDLLGSKDKLTKSERKMIIDDLLKNIDLTQKGRLQVKIADLGFAREMKYEDLSETVCGTPLVMAPEVLNGKRYNHKADVWSLGIIFYEMLVGFTPFTGRDKPDLKRNLERGEYAIPKQIKLSLQGLDFLNCCLRFDQAERLSWNELINHPYITSDPIEEALNAAIKQSQEQMCLQYSEIHDSWIRDDVLKAALPHAKLNERNSIALNVKNSKKYEEIYEQVIQKHFSRQINKPDLQQQIGHKPQDKPVYGDLAASMGPDQLLPPEERFDEEYKDVELLDQEPSAHQKPSAQQEEVKVSPLQRQEEAVGCLVLDTKVRPVIDDLEEINKQLMEIQRIQEMSPAEVLNQKPVMPGDDAIQRDALHFELVNEAPKSGGSNSPQVILEEKKKSADSNDDLVDLGNDSYYMRSQQESIGYLPGDSCVMIKGEQDREVSSLLQDLNNDGMFMNDSSMHVKENYFI